MRNTHNLPRLPRSTKQNSGGPIRPIRMIYVV